MSSALDELLQHPRLWRGHQTPRTGPANLASGFAALDELLPGGGWPLGALTEILHAQPGLGELRLLMPALVRLTEQGRWLAWVSPPHVPYAPALAGRGVRLDKVLLIQPRETTDALWALEQALRSGVCGAVLAWPGALGGQALRRLQLAAEAGGCWGVLFGDDRGSPGRSPAALRLALSVEGDRARLRLLKCRGGVAPRELWLDLDALPQNRPNPPVGAALAANSPELAAGTGRFAAKAAPTAALKTVLRQPPEQLTLLNPPAQRPLPAPRSR